MLFVAVCWRWGDWGLSAEVEEVGQLDGHHVVGRAGKVVALGAVVEVRQTVVVAPFEQEVAYLGAQLYAQTGGYAVVKPIVDGLAMLLGDEIGSVGQGSFPVACDALAVAQQETYLRTGMDEELHSPVATKGQMGQEGHLQVVHLAGIAQFGIVDVVLIPSALGIVELHLQATDHLEELFGDVAGRQSAVDATQLGLLYGRGQAHRGHVHTAVDTHGQVVTLIAYLGQGGRGTGQQKERGQQQQATAYGVFAGRNGMCDRMDGVLWLYTERFLDEKHFSVNDFLNMAQVVESFHSLLYNHPRENAEKYKARVKRIVGQVSKKDQEFVKSKLTQGNNLILAERLKELANKCPSDVVSIFIADVETFLKQVKDSRNYYTHYTKSGKKHVVEGAGLIRLTEQLKLLLTCNILVYLKFSKQQIIKIIENKKYHFGQLK